MALSTSLANGLLALLVLHHLQLTVGIRWMALHRVSPSVWNVSSPIAFSGGGGHWRRALKDDFGLSKRQERFCREAPELLPLLSKAAQTALASCQQAFHDRRWNCSSLTEAPRLSPDLTSGTREQAFVYALTSAAVAHTVSKACATGALYDCPCATTPRTPPDGNFKWGGCGDNVAYGLTVSKKFLDVLERGRARTEEDEELQSLANLQGANVVNKRKSLLALVNLHNNRAGRRALEMSVTQQCKCHGVSGSCNIKTCWRALTKVHDVAQRLKRRYATATEVAMQKRGIAGRRHLQPTLLTIAKLPAGGRVTPFGKEDLLYAVKSPDYCNRDSKYGSLGTRGRACNSSEEAKHQFDACSSMCCGRGFVTRREEILERCHCKYHWCCYVKCKTCQRTVFVSQCI
ncbi:protein Wnt-11b-2-like [Neocloeon triangulifer]|uniref:protein Wnt-11b-2-like n=1 Tax=Neocloeon triangulifer TaxID=2078957 RepID=UPI00286F003F|nr:protein Wnt-11b-2-like [Neocloeon triangulifer]